MTHITSPEKGPLDRPTDDEAGDIGSNVLRPLIGGNEDEIPTKSLEHPLLLITSTVPAPPPPPPITVMNYLN